MLNPIPKLRPISIIPTELEELLKENADAIQGLLNSTVKDFRANVANVTDTAAKLAEYYEREMRDQP